MNAAYRQLDIFQQLINGQIVKKQDLVDKYNVAPRVIQRDFSQIRQFIADQQLFYKMTYKRKLGGQVLETTQDSVSKQSILLIIKILLASRSLTSDEMKSTINGLLQLIPISDQKEIQPIIKNERFHYIPVHHQQPLLQTIWQFSQYIIKKQAVEIEYQKQHLEYKHYTILPEAVIFSEYYFYIISYSLDGRGNRYFRADRIRDYHLAPTKITQNYADRFKDGELRQYAQYMQPGKAVKIQFEFWGIVEAALDRFPNATVIDRKPQSNSVIIEAQTNDQGAKMWLLSQGKLVRVLAPESLVNGVKLELREAMDKY